MNINIRRSSQPSQPSPAQPHLASFWLRPAQVFCVAAVGWDRYVVLLAVGLERSGRFWTRQGAILGRGGRLGSLRSLASGRSGAFWTVLDGFGRHLCRSGLLGSLRSLASGRSGAV